MSNKSSGRVGVAWHKGHHKWIAYININGKRKYLGTFDNLDHAIAAREKAESEFLNPKNKSESKEELKLSRTEQEKSRYKNADMSGLTDDQRSCLLDYLDGVSAQDIADKLGVNKPVVYNRIREAKRIIDTGSAHSAEEIAYRKEYAKRYYQEHSERLKEYSRKYTSEHPDKTKETQKQSYERNREKRIKDMKEYNKRYYQKNRERILARVKERSRKQNNE